MAEISRFLFFRHLRSEASKHVVQYQSGEPVRSGRGLAFWFLPWSTSVAELPLDDQELTLLIRGRSRDFQEVSTQGVIFWRVRDPDAVARRLDFTLDLAKGSWQLQPMEQIANLLTEMAQQITCGYLADVELDTVLEEGVPRVRSLIQQGLRSEQSLTELGIEIVSVSIRSIRPVAEVEKALQVTTRERIQQEADRATFERRALAVERERAIAENELQNKIELAKREETLIGQHAQNERRRIREEAETLKLKVQAEAERRQVETESESKAIRETGAAEAAAEKARIDIYSALPADTLFGLAAKEFAVHLGEIEHLSVTPELIGPALARLAAK